MWKRPAPITVIKVELAGYVAPATKTAIASALGGERLSKHLFSDSIWIKCRKSIDEARAILGATRCVVGVSV